MQSRALTTYVQRIYYPFLMREPLKRSQQGTLCLLWLHSPFLGNPLGNPQKREPGNAAQLSCLAVVESMQKLPQALQHLKAAAQSASKCLTLSVQGSVRKQLLVMAQSSNYQRVSRSLQRRSSTSGLLPDSTCPDPDLSMVRRHGRCCLGAEVKISSA